ncbi:MAG: trehalose 6-phosphate synthase [Alphaproteobacteria bacterium]|nr:trehalose 6-phosphate synthase [Alphaproteobacteria bacterium]
MTLVVVSNRVACPVADEPIEGGLAAALLPAVQTCGAIWVGASQCPLEVPAKEPFATIKSYGAGSIATVDLPKKQYRAFYDGFSNSALWPALHSRPDLIRTSGEDYAAYREINTLMARVLIRFAKPDAAFWIHDYHYLALGADMRKLGITQPIGFFLHTPFPTRGVFSSVPHHRELIHAMLAYDLIGVQTDEDHVNLAKYLENELGLKSDGDVYKVGKRTVRIGTFPIGIDAVSFAARAVKAAGRPEAARLRASLQGARLAIGVDRVDYSKGLTNRLEAFDQLLQHHPALKRTVALLQIAVPSRVHVDAYQKLQLQLAGQVTEINGRHGEIDWAPIRYLTKGFSQGRLACFYRIAQVGLVTSLRDGMNLVAKEYVAAQDPSNPGVLVLSKFAGAAQQLDAAILVNPHDIEGLSSAIAEAFSMPQDERRERWDAMMKALIAAPLQAWFSDFVTALRMPYPEPAVVPESATLLPFQLRRREIGNRTAASAGQNLVNGDSRH